MAETLESTRYEIFIAPPLTALTSVKEKCCCPISKQRMLQPSSHHIAASPVVSPEGTQDGNRMPRIKQSAAAAHPPDGAPWGDSGWESTGHWPQVAEVPRQRNDFREPRLLHLPIHRKALNSLAWDVWFSLTNSNLLMFWPPGPCWFYPVVVHLPTPRPRPASSEQSLRVIWESCLPGFKSSESPPNKT